MTHSHRKSTSHICWRRRSIASKFCAARKVSLYGAEAIGGVISIFTKRGAPGVQAEAAVEGGSFSTINGMAAVRGATQTVNYALSATAFNSDGTNVSRFGSEDDGYRNRTVYASGGWAPVAGASLDASLRYRDSRSMFDPQDFGFPPGPTFGLIIDGDRQTEGEQLDTKLRGRLTTGRLSISLGLHTRKPRKTRLQTEFFRTDLKASVAGLTYQGTWRFGGTDVPQVLTLWAEYERLQFESKGPTPASRAKPGARERQERASRRSIACACRR